MEISKLEAGTKRTWKLHQTLDEIQKWSVYLQMSSERFQEELTGYSSRSTLGSPKRFQETMDCLQTLKKNSAMLKTLSHRLRGPKT